MKELLRDYQQEMKDRLYEAWTRCQSVMVQMPTGTGKTYLMAEVIREHMERGVMIVAHRIELTGQISKMLDRFGVPHGVIDRWTKDVEEVTSRHKVIVVMSVVGPICTCLASKIGIDDCHRAKSVATHKSANEVIALYGTCAVHIGEGNGRLTIYVSYYRAKAAS